MACKLTRMIDKSMAKNKDDPRDYVGASSIGDDCLRRIWYSSRDTESEPMTPKIQRIMQVGKKLEDLVIKWLCDAGVSVILPSVENNFLFCKDSEFDFFQGHCDGILPKLEAILEIKTANDTSFNKLVKSDVYAWNKQYMAQMQAYMGMTGYKKACIVVLNKDNSELYDEMVAFDAEFYESMRQRARMIYQSQMLPPKVHSSPLWWQCKMCKFNKVCHT